MKLKKYFLILLIGSIQTSVTYADEKTIAKTLNDQTYVAKLVDEIVNESGLTNLQNKATLRRNVEAMYKNDHFRNELKIFIEAFYRSQGRLPNAKESEKIGHLVGSRALNEGMKRMPKNDVRTYLMYNYRLMGLMSDGECVRFLNRLPTDEDGKGRRVYEIGEKLGDADFQNYMGMSFAAIHMSRSSNLSVNISDADARRINVQFVRKLIERIKEENIEETFNQWMQSGGRFDADEKIGCAIGKTLMGTMLSLPKEMSEDAAILFVSDRLLKN